MADTAALVVALSAQLTKFEKDLRAAGIMAEKAVSDIENKFSKMNPQFKASFLGNFFSDLAQKAIAGIGDAVKELAARFTELQKVSEYAGTSMQWVYGLQEAFKKSGAGVEEVNAAIKSIAFQLDEMKRGGDNPLKQLLAAPGNQQFLKGFNAQSATAEETFARILTIIGEMPNLIQAVDVAQKLSIPASVAAAAFKEGGDAITRMAAAAAKAAPDLENLANKAVALQGAWALFLDGLKSSALENTLAILQKIAAVAVAIGQIEIRLFKSGPLEEAANRELEKWQKIHAIVSGVGQEQFGPEKPPRRVTVTGGTAENPFARKGGGAAAQRDEFQRANDQITKHIALMEADTAAVGKGVYEQERLRTITLLQEAERRRLNIAEGEAIPISDELAKKIAAQADAAGKAALANAEAKRQLQELNSASQQLGSALSTAFADAILEGKSLNEVLNQLLKTLARAAINASIMNLFTPGASGINPFLSMIGLQGKMAGGPVNAGQPYLVGERGPELMVPGASGMVLPNNVLGRGMAGGTAISNAFYVSGDVSQSTIARLAQAVTAAHKKTDSLARVVTQTQRLQASGVG